MLLLAGTGCATQKYTVSTAQLAAVEGNPKAHYFLAIHYAKGDGLPKDQVKAAEYMRQAAESGYAFAQNDLGTYYLRGIGMPPDLLEANKWFHRAAEQGDRLAEYNLGRSYLEGRGVSRDVQEALKWYYKAARQNQPDAQVALGDLYFYGDDGIKADYEEAFKWYARAATYSCLNSLGFMYEKGLGVKKDLTKAVRCYQEAANRNDGRAQMNLGRMYRDGLGVQQNLVEAYKWFSLAVRNGAGAARHYQDELNGSAPLETGAKLTPNQIAEALRQADGFATAIARNQIEVNASSKH